MKIEQMTETELKELNPGIRTTVQTLRSWGYQTMDSGDGETHQFKCDRQHPYVVIRVHPAQLVEESHRLMRLLNDRGLRFDDPPHGQHDPEGWMNYPRMECIYMPNERIAIIDISNVILDWIEEENLEAVIAERNCARGVAEMLWKELDFIAKKHVGKDAPSPPKLPW
jgi:hypothetical protein